MKILSNSKKTKFALSLFACLHLLHVPKLHANESIKNKGDINHSKQYSKAKGDSESDIKRASTTGFTYEDRINSLESNSMSQSINKLGGDVTFINTGNVIGNVGIENISLSLKDDNTNTLGNGIFIKTNLAYSINQGKIIGFADIIEDKLETQNLESNKLGNAIIGVESGKGAANTGLVSGRVLIKNLSSSKKDADDLTRITKSGNGVLVNSIDVINNDGIIEGLSYLNTGSKNVNTITQSLESGNAIILKNNESLTNDGLLQGLSINSSDISKNDTLHKAGISNTQSGNGILNSKNIQNAGTISGQSIVLALANDVGGQYDADSDVSGNAILNHDNITNSQVKNQGVIKGNVYLSGGMDDNTDVLNTNPFQSKFSGNGIIDTSFIDNNGQISGRAQVNALGDSKSISLSSQSNSGNAILARNSNTSVKNSGIIAGKSQVSTSSEDENGNFIVKISDKNSGNGISQATDEQGIYQKTNLGDISNKGAIDASLGLNSSDFETYDIYLDSLANALHSNKGIGNVSNQGTLNAKADLNFQSIQGTKNEIKNIANGIDLGIDTVNGNITNQGLIQAELINQNIPQAINSGNGIFAQESQKNIKNQGTIKANAFQNNLGANNCVGAGVCFSNEMQNSLNNEGLIFGSEEALSINSVSSGKNISNYGVLAGQDIINTQAKSAYTNYGLEVTVDSLGKITSLKNGKAGTIDNKTIINANINGQDSFINISKDTEFTNNIINAAGDKTGALTAKNSKISLDNSIVNAYATAITLNGNSTLKSKDSIFNGGASASLDKNGNTIYKNVIVGDNTDTKVDLSGLSEVNGNIDLGDGQNTLNIQDESIINGTITTGSGADTLDISNNSIINADVNLGAGTDTFDINDQSTINADIDLGAGNDDLSISTLAHINKNLEGGDGNDTLNLGDSLVKNNDNIDHNGDGIVDKGDARGLDIYGNIDSFENLNIKGEVTTFETSTITGTKNIFIEKNSSLNVRIDSSKKDAKGRIIGDALYGNDMTISAEGNTQKGQEYETDAGVLNFITNGLGVGGVIAMNDNKGNKVSIADDTYIRTDSLINKANILDNGDIQIQTGLDLDDFGISPTPFSGDILYDKLNDIYKSIVANGDEDINALYPSVNLNDKTAVQAQEALLDILNQTFMKNPYGYSAKASKDSLDVIQDIQNSSLLEAKVDKWTFKAGTSYKQIKHTSSFKGYMSENYYGFDTQDAEAKLSSNMISVYVLAKYGLSLNHSLGLSFANVNDMLKVSDISHVNENALNIGIFNQNSKNNFSYNFGGLYQYSQAHAKRAVQNAYQYNDFKSNFGINAFNLYTHLKYDIALKHGFKVAPIFNLSLSNIAQDKISEGAKALAIDVKAQNFSYIDSKFGLDFTKDFSSLKYNQKLKANIAYDYSPKGYDAQFLDASMKQGTSFDILSPKEDKSSGEASLAYELNTNNGFSILVQGSYFLKKGYKDSFGTNLRLEYSF